MSTRERAVEELRRKINEAHYMQPDLTCARQQQRILIEALYELEDALTADTVQPDIRSYAVEIEAERDTFRTNWQDAVRELGMRNIAFVKLEEDRDRLKAALSDLAETEAAYRLTHDIEGDGHIDCGRAWDRMRRSGNRARAILAPPSDPTTRETDYGI